MFKSNHSTIERHFHGRRLSKPLKIVCLFFSAGTQHWQRCIQPPPSNSAAVVFLEDLGLLIIIL